MKNLHYYLTVFTSLYFSVSNLELSNSRMLSLTMATTDQISQKGNDGCFKSPSALVLEAFIQSSHKDREDVLF